VIIKVERSGGLTGIRISSEMDENDLPSSMVSKAKQIIGNPHLSIPMRSIPRGSADHYTYKISIRDGVNQRIINCSQYELQGDLKLLIKYIESNSKRK
jgi:hypothetical protein